MKNLCLLIFILATLHIKAQNKPLVVKFSSITPDIVRAAHDYYDHFFHYQRRKNFRNRKHDRIQKQNIAPGSIRKSTIMQIKSLQNVYSWQATMMNTDDHDKAVAKYKQIYRQLNGANFAMNDGKTCKIKGPYDAPDDDRAFASSILEPDVKEKYLQRLKIEVAP